MKDDAVDFNDETEAAVTFGPDICGINVELRLDIRLNTGIILKWGKSRRWRNVRRVFKDEMLHIMKLEMDEEDHYGVFLDGK